MAASGKMVSTQLRKGYSAGTFFVRSAGTVKHSIECFAPYPEQNVARTERLFAGSTAAKEESLNEIMEPKLYQPIV